MRKIIKKIKEKIRKKKAIQYEKAIRKYGHLVIDTANGITKGKVE